MGSHGRLLLSAWTAAMAMLLMRMESQITRFRRPQCASCDLSSGAVKRA